MRGAAGAPVLGDECGGEHLVRSLPEHGVDAVGQPAPLVPVPQRQADGRGPEQRRAGGFGEAACQCCPSPVTDLRHPVRGPQRQHRQCQLLVRLGQTRDGGLTDVAVEMAGGNGESQLRQLASYPPPRRGGRPARRVPPGTARGHVEPEPHPRAGPQNSCPASAISAASPSWSTASSRPASSSAAPARADSTAAIASRSPCESAQRATGRRSDSPQCPTRRPGRGAAPPRAVPTRGSRRSSPSSGLAASDRAVHRPLTPRPPPRRGRVRRRSGAMLSQARAVRVEHQGPGVTQPGFVPPSRQRSEACSAHSVSFAGSRNCGAQHLVEQFGRYLAVD